MQKFILECSQAKGTCPFQIMKIKVLTYWVLLCRRDRILM